MKLKDLFEGDVIEFPTKEKTGLDALLKLDPTSRDGWRKLEHFVTNEANPMALRIKALNHLYSSTGAKPTMYTAKDVDQFIEFAKETDELMGKYKFQESANATVKYVGSKTVKGVLPASRIEKEGEWTEKEIERLYPGKFNPLRPPVGKKFKTAHYVNNEVTINPGDEGHLESGPSRQILTRSGRGFASDSYFVRKKDHARVNVDQFPSRHKDIKHLKHRDNDE